MSWGGRRTQNIRRYFEGLLPLECPKCGLLIYPDQAWDIGHQQDQALGGSNDLSNLHPEHARCNRSAGGHLGHRLAGHKVRTKTIKNQTGRLLPLRAEQVARRDWTKVSEAK